MAGSALPKSRHHCQEFMPRHGHVSANIQFCFVVVRFIEVMEDEFWNWLICIFWKGQLYVALRKLTSEYSPLKALRKHSFLKTQLGRRPRWMSCMIYLLSSILCNLFTGEHEVHPQGRKGPACLCSWPPQCWGLWSRCWCLCCCGWYESMPYAPPSVYKFVRSCGLGNNNFKR